jgi:hypothetical protein
MKKLLLFLLLAAYMSGGAVPILSRVFGFGPATAHAQDEDQGDEDPGDQGEDEQ